MYSKTTGTSNVSKKPAATPMAATKPEGKTLPSHTLSFKTGEEGAKFSKLTGLWSATSKGGRNYLSAQVTQDIVIPAGSTLFVFDYEAKN